MDCLSVFSLAEKPSLSAFFQARISGQGDVFPPARVGILIKQKWTQGKAMHIGRTIETLEDFFKSILLGVFCLHIYLCHLYIPGGQ